MGFAFKGAFRLVKEALQYGSHSFGKLSGREDHSLSIVVLAYVHGHFAVISGDTVESNLARNNTVRSESPQKYNTRSKESPGTSCRALASSQVHVSLTGLGM